MEKTYIIQRNEIYHHGIKGQRWGVRRFQNEDGTWTAAGKERYEVDENGNMSKEGKKQYKQDKHDQKVLNRSSFTNAVASGLKTRLKFAGHEAAVLGGATATAVILSKKGKISDADGASMINGAKVVAGLIGLVGTGAAIASTMKGAEEKSKILESQKRNKK